MHGDPAGRRRADRRPPGRQGRRTERRARLIVVGVDRRPRRAAAPDRASLAPAGAIWRPQPVHHILLPFTGTEISRRALDAALRLARAEQATLMPAYLATVPKQLPLDCAIPAEADEGDADAGGDRTARDRARGSPVDARVERGRSYRHALRAVARPRELRPRRRSRCDGEARCRTLRRRSDLAAGEGAGRGADPATLARATSGTSAGRRPESERPISVRCPVTEMMSPRCTLRPKAQATPKTVFSGTAMPTQTRVSQKACRPSGLVTGAAGRRPRLRGPGRVRPPRRNSLVPSQRSTTSDTALPEELLRPVHGSA